MNGLVVKSTGLWYEVDTDQGRVIARLRGKFRLEDKKITNPIAVGDIVELTPNEQANDEFVITRIADRRNYLIRQSPRKKGHDHLLASNIDQGVLIATIKKPRTSIGFIDRFLISLEAFRIPGVIIFNKKDIYSKKELETYGEFKKIYEQIGYKVELASFLESAADVEHLFEEKTSLISGHSGTGKSTLINQLIPDANQAVKEISGFANKGVHTTTFAEMFKMGKDSFLIDTPGIKELGLAEITQEELSHYYPEMREYLGKCKFHNCLHFEEPGCAVKKAVGSTISLTRYENYLSILFQEDNRR